MSRWGWREPPAAAPADSGFGRAGGADIAFPFGLGADSLQWCRVRTGAGRFFRAPALGAARARLLLPRRRIAARRGAQSTRLRRRGSASSPRDRDDRRRHHQPRTPPRTGTRRRRRVRGAAANGRRAWRRASLPWMAERRGTRRRTLVELGRELRSRRRPQPPQFGQQGVVVKSIHRGPLSTWSRRGEGGCRHSTR